MTRVERSITERRTYSKTVTTCDLCGVSEVDLLDGEEIERVTVGEPEVEMRWFAPESEIVPGEGNEFDSYEEAKQWKDRDATGDIVRTVIKPTWPVEFDACSHCVEAFFSVFDPSEL